VLRGVREAHAAGGKVLVFVPTARQVSMFADAYNRLSELLDRNGREPLRCIELQSRQTESKRRHYAEIFRRLQSVVVFASDLAARGMDFPDVTLVVQVGAPKTRELYTHRLGRTARAGKSGAGILYLADYEEPLLESDVLRGLPFEDQSNDDLYLPNPPYEADVDWALEMVKRFNGHTGKRVYHAWLANHLLFCEELQCSKDDAVRMANEYATEVLMLPRIPALDEDTVEKMGLQRAKGLVVEGRDTVHSPSKLGNGFGYEQSQLAEPACRARLARARAKAHLQN